MWAEFANLFAGYGAIPMAIICLGTLLCIIEVFVPGFGYLGIAGGAIAIGGIIARMVMGVSVIQLLCMVVMVVLLILLAMLIMVILAKLGLVEYSPLLNHKAKKVSGDSANSNIHKKPYVRIIGKTTVADTDFNPTGKFTYSKAVYEATTYGELISKGEKIKIVEVKDNTIYVKKV